MAARRKNVLKKRIKKRTLGERFREISGEFAKSALKFSPHIVGAVAATALIFPNSGNELETKLLEDYDKKHFSYVSYNHPEDNTPKNREVLAQGLCGEGRSEFTNDYLLGAVAVMINRGNEIGMDNALLEKAQFSTFNFWDKNYKKIKDPINQFVIAKINSNHTEEEKRRLIAEAKKESGKIWNKCQDFANEILSGEKIRIPKGLEDANHYFVTSCSPEDCKNRESAKTAGNPGWAYVKNRNLATWYLQPKKIKEKFSDTFVLDKNKNRIPLPHLAKVPVRFGNNRHAYFYELPIEVEPEKVYLAAR